MPKATAAERLEATMLLTMRRLRAQPEVRARLEGMPPDEQAAHLATLVMEALRQDPDALALMAEAAEVG
jgi:hypothetical protein